MSRFTDDLVVSPLSDGRTWTIFSDFGYDIGAEGSGNTINVPIKFRTDFASVPRIFWVIISQWGKYGNAAVIHDYCYWAQTRSRKESDGIFLEAMGVLGVGWVTKHILYWSVRLFGGLSWNGHKKMRVKSTYKFPITKVIKPLEDPKPFHP
jgi:hypothetical protein